MTLDEAIRHAEEVAEENEEIYEAHCRIYSKEVVEKYPSPPCKECADEHHQLAEWLKELKAYRKAWEEAKRTVKAFLILEGFGNKYQDAMENLIEGCKPKEGDAG